MGKKIKTFLQQFRGLSLAMIAVGTLAGIGFGAYSLIPDLQHYIGKALEKAQGEDALVADISFLNPKIPPKVSNQDQRITIKRLEVLDDPENRISKEFKIPKGLKRRTKFWYNIYTQYGKYDHIIHHTRYPWIIFGIVRGEKIIENTKGPLWKRRMRVEAKAKSERVKIRAALNSLAKRKSFKKLPWRERQLYRKLRHMNGKRSKVFSFAAQNVRSQLGQKDFFKEGLARSSKYLIHMEDLFAEAGLPTELTRLPFVESSFNEIAESKVGASGIWQIMPKTGKAYFRVGKYIDERNSPIKATTAAAKLLRTYKRSLKKWPLAVTAYNHGIGNIRKSIRKSGSNHLPTIIGRYHQGAFQFASSNFYTSFLAALYAEKYHDVTFGEVDRDPVMNFIEVPLNYKMRVHSILNLTGLSKEELFIYNRDLKNALKKNLLLPQGYILHLPPSHGKKLQEELGQRDDVTIDPKKV